MAKFSFKIAVSIILAGLFIVVSFAALDYENLGSPFYIVSGFIVAFIFSFGFAMGHIYAEPVTELLKNMDGKVDGNEDSKKPEIKTHDEIEELARAFGKVTQGLEEKVLGIETQKKTSDIKFKTKDIVSEKVIDALEEKIKNRTGELERVTKERDQLKIQIQELQGQRSKK